MPAKPKPKEDAIRNDSDVDLHYPTLGVTLAPGESYTPKREE